MKCILTLALALFVITVYSCSSASKKQITDSIAKPNLQAVNTQLTKTVIAENQHTDTALIFPKFRINLHDFLVQSGADGTEKLHYNDDFGDDNTKKSWMLYIKTDSAHLQASGAYMNNIMELVPNDKTDIFKISYYSKVYINEINNKKGIKLEIIPSYIPLNDSLTYFFKIPYLIHDSKESPDVERVKNQLKLQDTTVKYKASDGKYYNEKLVSYKNKACEISCSDPLYLKIERFNKNKLMETKFLVIEYVMTEVAD
jgi:hypothetical protein